MQRVEYDQGAEDGERNGNGDDERGAPTAQENQNHQRRKTGGNHRFMDHPIDRGAYEDRLIGDSLDLQLGRKKAFDVDQLLPDRLDDGERGCRPGLHDIHEDGAAAVYAHDVGLGSRAVADVGDIVDIDNRPIDHLYGEVIEGGDAERRGIGLNLVLETADLDRAAWRNHVLRSDGVDDVGRRKPPGLKSGQVEIDHDRALLATVRIRLLCALNSGQLHANAGVGKVIELRLVEAPAG